MGTVEYDPSQGEGAEGESGVETKNVETAAPEEQAEVPASKPAVSGAMYTMLAREGVNAAQLINTALAKRTVGRTTQRRLEVAAPIGQSTSGGKKARQSLTLIAVSGDAPAVMIGWIDAAQKTGEIREYRALADQYQARFERRFEASLEEYTAFTHDLENMLKTLSFRIAREEFEESLPPPASGSILKTVAWVVGAAAVGGLIALLLS